MELLIIVFLLSMGAIFASIGKLENENESKR